MRDTWFRRPETSSDSGRLGGKSTWGISPKDSEERIFSARLLWVVKITRNTQVSKVTSALSHLFRCKTGWSSPSPRVSGCIDSSHGRIRPSFGDLDGGLGWTGSVRNV